ncbi:MAG: adenylate/guanylate cyclase domain-containing protein [Gaiellaceae bacterium]
MTVDGSEPTFLFADLSGFTALTEAHGDEQAADLLGEFCDVVRELLAAHDAHQVKTIGDAIMIRGGSASASVQLGTRIVRDVGAQHGFPMIRVGMLTGTAVERDGDWFGAAVNLAARVSGVASGGQVLVTENTRTSAGKVDGVVFREHGRQALKNIADPVLLFTAVTEGARDSKGLPIDPVCRMAVSPERSAGRLSHAGVEFHFCSLDCAGAFATEPQRYAAAASSGAGT